MTEWCEAESVMHSSLLVVFVG